MKFVTIFLVLIMFSTLCFAVGCEDNLNKDVLDDCLSGQLSRLDKALNSSYEKLKKKLSRENTKPAWLATDWVLSQFGETKAAQRAGYQRFVAAGVGLPSVWEDLQGQIYLGGEDFIQSMQSLVQQQPVSEEIPVLQLKSSPKALDVYRAEYAQQRNLGMALAYVEGGYTMQEIAKVFGVHYSTASRAVRKLERETHGEM